MDLAFKRLSLINHLKFAILTHSNDNILLI